MNINIYRFVKKLYSYSSSVGLSKCFSQYAVEPVNKDLRYPPIIDVTPEGKLRHERQLFYDDVQSLPTVEEKLHRISSQLKPTQRVHCMSAAAAAYNGVPFQQYITRTHLIRSLPQKHQEMDVDEIFNELKSRLGRVIASQLTDRWRTEKTFGERVSYELISLIYRMLSQYDFLQNSSFDIKPRIDAYWWHGGYISEKDKIDEKNLCFQYCDFPDFTMRIRTPLAPIVPLDDSLCASADVLDYNYHPTTCAAIPFKTRKFITSVPGFWPGDVCEYPLMCFQSTKNISELKAKLDHAETLMSPTIEEGFGIMSSFGWLMGIAMNQGFTPFHDVTYPLVTQTVITDGQDWYFFVYQLNTMCFHSDVDLKNKRNICWSSGKMRLYEAVENGELRGVNDEVFKVLLRFFLNSPQVPKNVELKPYLSTPTKSAEELNIIKERLLKMYSNRPDPRAHKYEVPMWQHIYKWHRDAPPSPQIKLQ